MSSPWIQHVKQFQRNNGCSYKDAMIHARASYQPVSGGKFSINKMRKKVIPKQARKITKAMRQFESFVPEEYQDEFSTAQGLVSQAGNMDGGKFRLGKALRKTKNTVSRVAHTTKDVARVAAPLMMMSGNPALMSVGAALEGGIQATGGSFNSRLGRKEARGTRAPDGMDGGRFNLKHAVRKARHTATRVAPVANVIDPRAGSALELVGNGFNSKGGYLRKLNIKTSHEPMGSFYTQSNQGGSFRTQGGSYRVQGAGLQGGGGSSHCRQCGAIHGGNLLPKSLNDRNYR